MKNTQNEKISQIKNSTLVVGIDVAKETHYVRAFNFRGIKLSKLLKISNTAEDFDHLTQWMQSIYKKHEKADIIVSYKPTSHCCYTMGDYLKSQGHKLTIVNLFHVKRTISLPQSAIIDCILVNRFLALLGSYGATIRNSGFFVRIVIIAMNRPCLKRLLPQRLILVLLCACQNCFLNRLMSPTSPTMVAAVINADYSAEKMLGDIERGIRTAA